jgi:hypothetical protein
MKTDPKQEADFLDVVRQAILKDMSDKDLKAVVIHCMCIQHGMNRIIMDS